jgi:hypothetical protein
MRFEIAFRNRDRKSTVDLLTIVFVWKREPARTTVELLVIAAFDSKSTAGIVAKRETLRQSILLLFRVFLIKLGK